MTQHVRQGPPKIYIWVPEQPGGNFATSKVVQIDISKNVLSFQCSKQMGQPAGSFQLTLLPVNIDGSGVGNIRDFDIFFRQVRPNSLVSIGFEEPGGIMLGLVDRIVRSKTLGGPNPGAAIAISGRDMGKALVADNIIRATTEVSKLPEFMAQVIANLGSESPILTDLIAPWAITERGNPIFQAGTLDDVVDFLLKKVPLMQVPLLSSIGAETIGKFLENDWLFVKSTPIETDQIWKDAIKDFQGNVWSFLNSCLDPDLYEVWIDTIPACAMPAGASPSLSVSQSAPAFAVPVLILRPKPFDETSMLYAPVKEDLKYSWTDLKTLVDNTTQHEIAEDEIVNESLTVDDSQSFSYYMVTSQHDLLGNSQGPSLGLSLPLVDFYNARQYGMKAYNTRLVMAGVDVETARKDPDGFGTAVRSRVQEVRNRLFNWYRLNPWFETGSITVVGRDRFRIGDPVFREGARPQFGGELGIRYYTTGVSWSWSFGGQYLSTLQVSRGHNNAMVNTINSLIFMDGANYGNPLNFVSVDT